MQHSSDKDDDTPFCSNTPSSEGKCQGDFKTKRNNTSISMMLEERSIARKGIAERNHKVRVQSLATFSRVKKIELNLIQEFEAKRNQFFVGQFHTHQKYWQVFVSFMRDQSSSTDRLISWFSKRLHTYQAFSNQLLSIDESFPSPKRKLSLKSAGLQSIDNSSSIPTTRSTNHLQTIKSVKSDTNGRINQLSHTFHEYSIVLAKDHCRNESTDLVDQLSSIDQFHALSIQRLNEFMENQVLTRLKSLSGVYSHEMDKIVKDGEKELSRLQEIDVFTNKAFENFHRISAGLLVAPGESSVNSFVANDSSTNFNTMKRSAEAHDMWLADMHYRVAAHHQRLDWQDIASLMKGLFDKMRSIEIERKKTTQEVLLTTLEMTDKLWKVTPNSSKEIKALLDGMILSEKVLEKEIEKVARRKTAASQKENGCFHLAVPSENSDFEENIEMPLPNPLVLHSGILWRRGEGIVKGTKGDWLSCVAVLTVDMFLHIFDCRANDEGFLGQPEDVFGQLVSDGTSRVKRGEKDSIVVPTSSFDVSYHTVAPRQRHHKPIHDCQFWVREIVQNSGIKGFFKGESSRRILLRAKTVEERNEWINIIKLTNQMDERRINRESPERSIAQDMLNCEED